MSIARLSPYAAAYAPACACVCAGLSCWRVAAEWARHTALLLIHRQAGPTKLFCGLTDLKHAAKFSAPPAKVSKVPEYLRKEKKRREELLEQKVSVPRPLLLHVQPCPKGQVLQ